MTSGKHMSDQGTSLLPGEERRRSQRVVIRVPVVLEVMMSGQKITAVGHTVAVNLDGAMVLCSRPFDAGTKLEIFNQNSRERAQGRVTRSPRDTNEGFLIPLEFDKSIPMFWQISFPPSN